MDVNLHDITNEEVISQDDKNVVIEFTIPITSDFFDGHFPEYKLLPAVAQIEIITRFAKKYFGTKRYISNIKRAKFSAPVRPDTRIHLEMSYKKEKNFVKFNMVDANVEGKSYSSGGFSAMPL